MRIRRLLVAILALGAANIVGCAGAARSVEAPGSQPSLAALIFTEGELPNACAPLPADDRAPFPNPTLSADPELVAAFVSMLSEDAVDSRGVEEALFSVYVEEAEVGLFAFRLATTEQARTFLQGLPAVPESSDRSRTYQAGRVAAWLWHDGVSPACWSSMQELVREKLAEAQ